MKRPEAPEAALEPLEFPLGAVEGDRSGRGPAPAGVVLRNLLLGILGPETFNLLVVCIRMTWRVAGGDADHSLGHWDPGIFLYCK